MQIDRKKLILKHNPKLQKVVFQSPLTVGNGSIAFTADVTGMQSLYEEQKNADVPLLTMSDWGWHTTLAEGSKKKFTLDDLVMTEYDCNGRTFRYGVEMKPGNEMVYNWLRKNPHRYNLARIGLLYKGKEITSEQLSGIQQELDLYSGILYSTFIIDNTKVEVTTLVHQERDTLGFRINSEACEDGRLTILMDLPYGSHNITGSIWDAQEKHTTDVLKNKDNVLYLHHQLDEDECYIFLQGDSIIAFEQVASHTFTGKSESSTIQFTLSFSLEEIKKGCHFEECFNTSKERWKRFWEEGGIISFEGSKDSRADELERRIILSLYLSAINSCTTMPPQETGLTVNSWYGKSHLEMYLWHLAYLPLWGRTSLLKRSLGWYKTILENAKENAARNGYKGAKWPKMVGPEGIDCPSTIATLLVWQQPHIIYILELAYLCGEEKSFLEEYWEMVKETAQYMVDFAVYNKETMAYDLVGPLIPAQECHKPEDTKNPTFEIEYWRFGLWIAEKWAERLNKTTPQKWKEVAQNMAKPTVKEGVYLAHENCPKTYEQYAEDHPSMVAALGLLPGDRIDPKIMENTLEKIYDVWQFKSMWGWDFAMMAMTETRLGNPEKALNILLYETEKNAYVESGNNMQVSRSDLPLYLPGNGSLLLAIPIMAAGYSGSNMKHPGFPKNETWQIQYEGIFPFPY
ncbi:hypothetical protein EDC18_10250 [Natranaerovirga pectinivora]|uniref:Glycosyl hydrolase family 65 n=1 Tax=Natranaerovirga pectinivora TaxID=682400 RepID=A0A4R3MQ94_9FIRM|nr:glycoside hydrolase family 65 [Natranaerovirga pectinivora]TCT16036.1 hypothetical protein EDC18_10250 [Natranaerovirga pectinivora]